MDTHLETVSAAGGGASPKAACVTPRSISALCDNGCRGGRGHRSCRTTGHRPAGVPRAALASCHVSGVAFSRRLAPSISASKDKGAGQVAPSSHRRVTDDGTPEMTGQEWYRPTKVEHDCRAGPNDLRCDEVRRAAVVPGAAIRNRVAPCLGRGRSTRQAGHRTSSGDTAVFPVPSRQMRLKLLDVPVDMSCAENVLAEAFGSEVESSCAGRGAPSSSTHILIHHGTLQLFPSQLSTPTTVDTPSLRLTSRGSFLKTQSHSNLHIQAPALLPNPSLLGGHLLSCVSRSPDVLSRLLENQKNASIVHSAENPLDSYFILCIFRLVIRGLRLIFQPSGSIVGGPSHADIITESTKQNPSVCSSNRR